MKKLIYLCLLLACMVSCTEDEFTGYDTPFIHIATSTGASSTTVLSNVNNINTYNVIVSSRPLSENLTVNYEIIVGAGLQEGVDYELVTTGNTLTFEPGVYDMPIRIHWIAHKVDSSKDNTITIRLTGNNQNMTLGLPGPSGLQKELVIEKQN
jgi:hypothetical protein